MGWLTSTSLVFNWARKRSKKELLRSNEIFPIMMTRRLSQVSIPESCITVYKVYNKIRIGFITFEGHKMKTSNTVTSLGNKATKKLRFLRFYENFEVILENGQNTNCRSKILFNYCI